VSDRAGTIVAVRLPLSEVPSTFHPGIWARAFALFNPHAAVRIREFDSGAEHAQNGWLEKRNSYGRSVSFPEEWRKFLPGDLVFPWWYTPDTLGRLIGRFTSREDGAKLSLCMFVQRFRGLSGTAKAGRFAKEFPEIRTLSDFEGGPGLIARLLEAMRAETTTPSPGVLGSVGE
jgi:hypothetical protein